MRPYTSTIPMLDAFRRRIVRGTRLQVLRHTRRPELNGVIRTVATVQHTGVTYEGTQGWVTYWPALGDVVDATDTMLTWRLTSYPCRECVRPLHGSTPCTTATGLHVPHTLTLRIAPEETP